MSNKLLYAEGNNGGNYIQVNKLNDNLLRLEVGDCCVKTIEVTITVEALTSLLNSIQKERGFLNAAEHSMSWAPDVNERFWDGCKDLLE